MLLGICSKMQKQGERPRQAVKLTLCRPDFESRNGRTWVGFFVIFELYRNVYLCPKGNSNSCSRRFEVHQSVKIPALHINIFRTFLPF
jgi:hypothetical protein